MEDLSNAKSGRLRSLDFHPRGTHEFCIGATAQERKHIIDVKTSKSAEKHAHNGPPQIKDVNDKYTKARYGTWDNSKQEYALPPSRRDYNQSPTWDHMEATYGQAAGLAGEDLSEEAKNTPFCS